MRRRKVVFYTGTVLATGLAGCTGDESNSNNVPQTGQPTPTVIEIRSPQPQVVSTNAEQNNNGSLDISVTIQNTGSSGPVEMTLVFLENANINPWSSSVGSAITTYDTYERFFSAGERRTETVTASEPEGYSRYGFRLKASEGEVDVRNSGGSGSVGVTIDNGNDSPIPGVGGFEVIEMAAESTRTVTVDLNYNPMFIDDSDDIEPQAEATPVNK